MKPYLLSIGFGLPLFGLWGHRYIPVKRRYRGSKRFAGVHVVWATYTRRQNEDR